jgi:hypothetical protein
MKTRPFVLVFFGVVLAYTVAANGARFVNPTDAGERPREPRSVMDAYRMLIGDTEGDTYFAARWMRSREAASLPTEFVLEALLVGARDSRAETRAESARALSRFPESAQARAAVCEIIRTDESAHVTKWAANTAATWARSDMAPCILDGIMRSASDGAVVALSRAAVALRLTSAIGSFEERARHLDSTAAANLLDAVFVLRRIADSEPKPRVP